MIKFKIVDKKVKKSLNEILFPSIKIKEKEFIDAIERSDFIWYEDSESGKSFAKFNKLPIKVSALLDARDSEEYVRVTSMEGSLSVIFDPKVQYEDLVKVYEFAKVNNWNLWLITPLTLIDDAYMEAFRQKEEAKGIKLTKEQRKALSLLDDQCRWFHIPSDDKEKIFNKIGINPILTESDAVNALDSVQNGSKIAVCMNNGNTIIIGRNVPYIMPNSSVSANHAQLLIDTLNNLSKSFGASSYFEYNDDDTKVLSLALSKKGKLVYAKFTSEGQGEEFFGTQTKSMNLDKKVLLKTAKKQGLVPEEILIEMVKLNKPIQVFNQSKEGIF
jgi:hypothetical protein